MSTVVVESLSKTFGGRKQRVEAVRPMDLTIEQGELLVLLGPSGCGKTTLLRCLAGLERPTTGKVWLGGELVFDAASKKNVPPNGRDIGMVFQGFALWPHMTVTKNVDYPLVARKMKEAREAGRVEEVLKAVRCYELRDRLPGQLSGGQQQRVALARALASNPALLLLDEPLSNLDALLRAELRIWLREVHRSIRYTGVYVTHDQLEAFQLGTRVAVMQAGEVIQVGKPQEVHDHPATPEIAEFLGISNRLTVTRDGDTWATPAGVVRGPLDRDPRLGDRAAQVFMRPEDVRLVLASDGGVTSNGTVALGQGRVRDVLYAGNHVEHIVDLGGAKVVAVATPGSALFKQGDEVIVQCEASSMLVYPGAEPDPITEPA